MAGLTAEQREYLKAKQVVINYERKHTRLQRLREKHS